MGDTIFILVIGDSEHEHSGSINKISGKTNYGDIDIEYINRINQQYDDIHHHDFTIAINSESCEVKNGILYIEHGNYKRRSVVEKVMSEITKLDVKLLEKPKKSDDKEFIYLDPEFCIEEHKLVDLCYNTITSYITKMIIVWEFIIFVIKKLINSK